MKSIIGNVPGVFFSLYGYTNNCMQLQMHPLSENSNKTSEILQGIACKNHSDFIAELLLNCFGKKNNT